MHRRVLVLGSAGVDKRAAMEAFAAGAARYSHEFKIVDFDKDLVEPIRPFFEHLNDDISLAANTWSNAWDDFKREGISENTILCMHSAYVTAKHGARSVVDIAAVCENFKPDLIVTLLDDVYSTRSRTSGQKLSPTLEQLLMARRIEALFGDLAKGKMATKKMPVRHIFISVNHPIECLINLIVFEAEVTYLSFPISEPRKELKKGDKTFVDLINSAHCMSLNEMRQDQRRCFISPLAIDELPFVPPITASDHAESTDESPETWKFDESEKRWSLKELWGEATLLRSDEPRVHEFSLGEIISARGIIETDVGWRDRRLALQSDDLAVICPKPRNRDGITRGVRNEIQTAAPQAIPIHIWQEQTWDPDGVVVNEFAKPGSMGSSMVEDMAKLHETLEQLIKRGKT